MRPRAPNTNVPLRWGAESGPGGGVCGDRPGGGVCGLNGTWSVGGSGPGGVVFGPTGRGLWGHQAAPSQMQQSTPVPPTGVVRTALPDLDREAKDTHLLVVQAKDMIGQMGGLSGTTSVTVIVTDVNDNPPRFPRSEFTLVLLGGVRVT